jgi:integrase
MDSTVCGLGEIVVAALRGAGYAASTVSRYETTVRTLGRFAAERGEVYTSPLGAQFVLSTTSKNTGGFYARLVGLFDGLIATGQVDLAPRAVSGGGQRPVCEEHVRLVDSWHEQMVENGLAEATRCVRLRIVVRFLRFLEDRGSVRLGYAAPVMVTGFLSQGTATDCWTTSLRSFLTFAGRRDLVQAVDLAGVRRSHSVLPVVTDEDARRVFEVCAADGQVAARDASITLLALTTGLRARDIIDLVLGGIDWHAATVSLVQHKTHNAVTVPLSGFTLTRLAQYVLEERPAVDDDHVFLRKTAPFAPLAGYASTIHKITTAVFAQAGVGEPNAGTRRLRHTAATRMLRAATPLTTISAVLGHASSETTRTYLSVDDDRLRDCVLPVPAGALS